MWCITFLADNSFGSLISLPLSIMRMWLNQSQIVIQLLLVIVIFKLINAYCMWRPVLPPLCFSCPPLPPSSISVAGEPSGQEPPQQQPVRPHRPPQYLLRPQLHCLHVWLLPLRLPPLRRRKTEICCHRPASGPRAVRYGKGKWKTCCNILMC